MPNIRELTQREIAELTYALAIARNKNDRHAEECGAEELNAQDSAMAGHYKAERERYETAADVDATLVDLILGGKIVVIG
jgi:hypothetical protein